MLPPVHLRWSRADRPADDPFESPGWLDAGERERHDAFRRPERQVMFATTRRLLKELVGELAHVPAETIRLRYDCPRCGRAHGRPTVVDPPPATRWSVSLATAGAYAVAAATLAGPVGVDVEHDGATAFNGFDDVALSRPEREEIRDLADDAQRARARTIIWVRKEALLKALGTGLNVDPRAVRLSSPSATPTVLTAPADLVVPHAVRMSDVPFVHDHSLAVAVLRSVDDATGEIEDGLLVELRPPLVEAQSLGNSV